MENITYMIFWIVIGYAIGSILFGEITTKLSGIGDIRKTGSGNVGATNVLRGGHKYLAIFTLIGDSGKGIIIVLFTYFLTENANYSLFSGLSCIIGHDYPFLKFKKGGKGVATSFGVHLALFPLIGALSILIWLIVFFLFRRSSVAAILALVSIPLVGLIWKSDLVSLYNGYDWYFVTTAIAGLACWRHKKNIQRMFLGQENKISFKK